jgi:hypothetical protein
VKGEKNGKRALINVRKILAEWLAVKELKSSIREAYI